MFETASASTSITPSPPYPPRLLIEGDRLPFTQVADELESNVLCFRADSTEVVVVSLDLLCVGDSLRQAVVERSGLRDDQLIMFASHTHYAPMTQTGTPWIGVPDPGYIDMVASRTCEAINRARARYASCEITYSHGDIDASMNRRLTRFRASRERVGTYCEIGPNPKGSVDRSARFVRFENTNGDVAVLWNFACHPTGFPQPDVITAEYPGVVRRALRSAFGANGVLFAQGFAGDLRPPFIERPRGLRAMAKRLLLGPLFGQPTLAEWRRWSDLIASDAVRIMSGPAETISVSALRSWCAEVPLADFATDAPPDATISFCGIEFGAAMAFVGVGAEPVHDYRALVLLLYPERHLLTAGYVGQLRCYLPTARMVTEGGYEVTRFAKTFSFTGKFDSRVESAFSRGAAPPAAANHTSPETRSQEPIRARC